MDQCVSTQYAGHGCIGTAVTTHGTLPFTGFESLAMLAVALVIIFSGVAMRVWAGR